jgi:hypothetical protein
MAKRKKGKRTHIPALSPEEIQVAMQKLQATRIPPAAKKQLAAMIQAAANPNSETPEAVIKTLPEKRRAQIKELTTDINQHTAGVLQRAGDALEAMSDAEWDRLVEEANGTD